MRSRGEGGCTFPRALGGEAPTSQPQLPLDLCHPPQGRTTVRCEGHQDDVNAVAYADATSQLIFSGSDDCYVKASWLCVCICVCAHARGACAVYVLSSLCPVRVGICPVFVCCCACCCVSTSNPTSAAVPCMALPARHVWDGWLMSPASSLPAHSSKQSPNRPVPAAGQVWDRRIMSSRRSKPAGVLVGHTEGITHIDSKVGNPSGHCTIALRNCK